MKSILVLATLTLAANAASAAEYVCRVYCKGPDGSTVVVVKADSPSEAASIVDKQSDQVCRAADHDRSTSSTMSSDQCWKK